MKNDIRSYHHSQFQLDIVVPWTHNNVIWRIIYFHIVYLFVFIENGRCFIANTTGIYFLWWGTVEDVLRSLHGFRRHSNSWNNVIKSFNQNVYLLIKVLLCSRFKWHYSIYAIIVFYGFSFAKFLYLDSVWSNFFLAFVIFLLFKTFFSFLFLRMRS
jgi:hypothetical protein